MDASVSQPRVLGKTGLPLTSSAIHPELPSQIRSANVPPGEDEVSKIVGLKNMNVQWANSFSRKHGLPLTVTLLHRGKGATMSDVRKIFGYFLPLPPLSALWTDL